MWVYEDRHVNGYQRLDGQMFVKQGNTKTAHLLRCKDDNGCDHYDLLVPQKEITLNGAEQWVKQPRKHA